MTYITPIPGQSFGYDVYNNTQVIGVDQNVTLLLVAGAQTTVTIDDGSKVELVGGAQSTDPGDTKLPNLDAYTATQTVQRITLRGRTAGQTLLHARTDGAEQLFEPLRLVVVPNKLNRQVDGSTLPGEALRDDAQGGTLHEIAVRIAQDQLHSGERSIANGGDYGADVSKSEDWCGIFAWWCWEQAAKVKAGVANPFGDKNSLRSPQKAINWALLNPTKFRLFNVKVATHVADFAKPPAATLLVPSPETPVLPGDIMLERHRTPTGKDGTARNFFTQWKHIGLVTSTITSPFGGFDTIEGNQGSPQSIKAYRHDNTERIYYPTGDHPTRFAFVGVIE